MPEVLLDIEQTAWFLVLNYIRSSLLLTIPHVRIAMHFSLALEISYKLPVLH